MGAAAVDLSASVELGVIHDLLMETVHSKGRVRLRDLVEATSRRSRATAGEVTAAVWDLIQENKLRYGSDAYVSLSEM
jgi:hypothetical protein